MERRRSIVHFELSRQGDSSFGEKFPNNSRQQS
ncbi:hypothetical protein D917_08654 [Trichinella nativa]|uniref:Uncharacterized protein n=1 Tax=Trichinella nativa TaxID=6335 RepID=A0A1Y3EIY8_9BILA|nr:hypothetical protein D917_08654 [Trichinella nativa]